MPNNKPNRVDAPPEAAPRWPALALMVALGFFSVAHLPFVPWNAYGSDDSAWDGIAIMLWSQHHRLPTETGLFVEERFRSSPLPAYLTKQLLAIGLLPYSGVPFVMHAGAALAGIALPGILYFVVRQWGSNADGAIAASLLLLSPEFFSLKLDGLPTLPAAAFLLLSLYFFVMAMQYPKRWLLGVAVASGFFVFATLTKVDVVLLSPAFLVAALVVPPRCSRWKYAALSIAIPVACVAIWHLFCRAVAPDAPQTAESFQRWSQRWALAPGGLWDRDNQTAMLMAPGVGSALALVPAAVFCLLYRPTRWLLAAALACTVPTILFWGMRELNSSRHNFWLVIPIAVIIAVAVHCSIQQMQWKVIVTVAICAGNYLLGPGPAQESYRQATSQFLTAALARQSRVEKERDDYELLTLKRGAITKMCIWDVGPARARAIAAFVAHADHCDVRVVGQSHNDWRITAQVGKESIFVWLPDAPTLKSIWPEICRGEYDLFMPGTESAPFFHIRGSPQAFRSKEPTIERWPP